jgi:BolA protein
MKEEKLRKNLLIFFDESEIEIINNSEKHRHHSGYSDGESHFLIKITSNKVKNMKAIEKHRHVISLIGKELTDAIHSIEIKFK